MFFPLPDSGRGRGMGYKARRISNSMRKIVSDKKIRKTKEIIHSLPAGGGDKGVGGSNDLWFHFQHPHCIIQTKEIYEMIHLYRSLSVIGKLVFLRPSTQHPNNMR